MNAIDRLQSVVPKIKLWADKEKRKQVRSAIPIDEFGPDWIRRKKKYLAILKITDPINRDLFSDDETEKTIEALQSILNTLQINDYVQILVSSQKIDMEQYLRFHDQKLEPLEINAQYGEQYLRWDEKFRMERLKRSKEFMNEYANKARNVPSFFMTLEQDNQEDLDNLVADVLQELEDGKIGAERMKAKDIQKVLYEKLAPTTSREQPFENFDITEWKPNSFQRRGGRYFMDDMFHSFYTISYIPDEVDPGWLDSLIRANSLNVDISITSRCVDKSELVKSIDNRIRELTGNLHGSLPPSMKKVIQRKIDGFDQLLDEIDKEDENIFEATIVICVKEKTMDDLKKSEKRLRNNLKKLKSRRLMASGPELLWYTLPIAYRNREVEDPVSWQMQADLIASIIPFNSTELNEQIGILIGFNNKNDSPVIYSIWDTEKFNNRNHVILGAAGGGKSFFVKSLLFREIYMGEADRIFIIDPEREYGIFPGANIIQFKPGSTYCTNPFHIRTTVVESEREEDEDIIDVRQYLPLKISQMMTFFSWIYPDMTPVEKSYLRQGIQQCYKEESGLDVNDPRPQRLPEEFPTLGDLNRRLRKIPVMEEFCIVLRDYVDGIYSSMFNGQTNWDLDAKVNVLDIGDLTGDSQKPMMDLLIGSLWEEVKADKDEKTILVCDEAWLLADERNPQTLDFLGHTAKRIRKYMGCLWVATQNVADFLSVGKFGEAIINNSFIQTYMSMLENDVKKLEGISELSEKELALLRKQRQGRAIHRAGNIRIDIRSDVSEDEQSILKIKREKKKKSKNPEPVM